MEPFDADKNQADDQLGINYIEFPAQDFDANGNQLAVWSDK